MIQKLARTGTPAHVEERGIGFDGEQSESDEEQEEAEEDEEEEEEKEVKEKTAPRGECPRRRRFDLASTARRYSFATLLSDVHARNAYARMCERAFR